MTADDTLRNALLIIMFFIIFLYSRTEIHGLVNCTTKILFFSGRNGVAVKLWLQSLARVVLLWKGKEWIYFLSEPQRVQAEYQRCTDSAYNALLIVWFQVCCFNICMFYICSFYVNTCAVRRINKTFFFLSCYR